MPKINSNPSDQTIDQLQKTYDETETNLGQALADRAVNLLNTLNATELIIEPICPYIQDAIFTGEHTDTVTKITAEGDYWSTTNGERSSEEKAGSITFLPILALQRIRNLLEFRVMNEETPKTTNR